MNSPVIPASHETGRYRVTCRHGGSTAKMTWYDMRQRDIADDFGGVRRASRFGKFVLARRLADALDATYLRIDTIESAAISTLMLPITLCDWSST